jgi:hypothetical protein
MKIIEVIQKANAFVFQNTGVEGDPDFVRLIENPGKHRSWRLVYKADLFFPQEAKRGAVIDDGEYVVSVDEASGDVSVLN